MKNRAVWGAISAVLFVIGGLHCFADTQTDVGRVMDIRGAWLMDGQPLKLFQALPPGGKIYRSTEDEKKNPQLGRILVLLRDRSRISRSYETPEGQRGPIELPKSVNDATPGFWARLKGFLTPAAEGKEDIVPTLARGTNDQLRDGVLLLRNGALDLSPSFRDMDHAHYLLRFTPINQKANRNRRLPPVAFHWIAAKPEPLHFTGISTGLYELALLDYAGEDHDPTGEKALILISSEADNKKLSAEFREAQDLEEGFGKESSAQSKRRFLWAALQSLAQ